MNCAACTKSTKRLVPHNGKGFCMACAETRKIHQFLQQIPCEHTEWPTISTILDGTRAVLQDVLSDHKRKIEDERMDEFLGAVPVTLEVSHQHRPTEHDGTLASSNQAWLPPWSAAARDTPPPRPPWQHTISLPKRPRTTHPEAIPAHKAPEDRSS